MKDEFKGKMISEFVGLKTKMYSLIYVDSKENKKAKGVNKNIVKTLRLKDFLTFCLIKKMKRIQGTLHRIRTFQKFVKFLCLVLIIKDIY